MYHMSGTILVQTRWTISYLVDYRDQLPRSTLYPLVRITALQTNLLSTLPAGMYHTSEHREYAVIRAYDAQVPVPGNIHNKQLILQYCTNNTLTFLHES